MDLPRPRAKTRIAIFVAAHQLHGLAEAGLLVVLLSGQIDGSLGPAPLHLVRLAIAELLLLLQHLHAVLCGIAGCCAKITAVCYSICIID